MGCLSLVVKKYGGSSLASLDHIRRVASAVALTRAKGHQVAVVVSAIGGQTDYLLKMASEITSNPSGREQDALVATGEQVSAALLALALEGVGQRAKSLTALQIPLQTDGIHTRARITGMSTTVLQQALDEGYIPVVAGFQGQANDGSITTLGRGGSDTTAVALAASLEADCCEIFTDVDGVYTADPNICPRARHLEKISYQEMLELAGLGAKVLHVRSVELAQKYSVPLVVKSSFGSARETWIVKEEELMENAIIKGVTLEKNVSKISLLSIPDRPGIAHKILAPLAESSINIDMIIQNVGVDGLTDLTFTISTTDLEQSSRLVNEVAREIGAQEIVADNNIAKISAVGIGIKTNPGIAARMFKALADENINIEMISTSEYRISCVIKDRYGELAVRAVHSAFGLENGEFTFPE